MQPLCVVQWMIVKFSGAHSSGDETQVRQLCLESTRSTSKCAFVHKQSTGGKYRRRRGTFTGKYSHVDDGFIQPGNADNIPQESVKKRRSGSLVQGCCQSCNVSFAAHRWTLEGTPHLLKLARTLLPIQCDESHWSTCSHPVCTADKLTRAAQRFSVAIIECRMNHTVPAYEGRHHGDSTARNVCRFDERVDALSPAPSMLNFSDGVKRAQPTSIYLIQHPDNC